MSDSPTAPHEAADDTRGDRTHPDVPSGTEDVAQPPDGSPRARNEHARTAYGPVRGFDGANPELSQHDSEEI